MSWNKVQGILVFLFKAVTSQSRYSHVTVTLQSHHSQLTVMLWSRFSHVMLMGLCFDISHAVTV